MNNNKIWCWAAAVAWVWQRDKAVVESILEQEQSGGERKGTFSLDIVIAQALKAGRIPPLAFATIKEAEEAILSAAREGDLHINTRGFWQFGPPVSLECVNDDDLCTLSVLQLMTLHVEALDCEPILADENWNAPPYIGRYNRRGWRQLELSAFDIEAHFPAFGINGTVPLADLESNLPSSEEINDSLLLKPNFSVARPMGHIPEGYISLSEIIRSIRDLYFREMKEINTLIYHSRSWAIKSGEAAFKIFDPQGTYLHPGNEHELSIISPEYRLARSTCKRLDNYLCATENKILELLRSALYSGRIVALYEWPENSSTRKKVAASGWDRTFAPLNQSNHLYKSLVDDHTYSANPGWGIISPVLFVEEQQVDQWLSSLSKLSLAAAKPRAVRGAKPKYDWSAFKSKVLEILEYHGGISPSHEPDFNQACIEKRMTDWCDKEWGQVPSESTIRKYVRKSIDEYEAHKLPASPLPKTPKAIENSAFIQADNSEIGEPF